MNKRKTIIAFYKTLKIISILCAVVSVAALIAVTLYILVNGVSKLNSELLFGDYSTGYPGGENLWARALRLIAGEKTRNFRLLSVRFLV